MYEAKKKQERLHVLEAQAARLRRRAAILEQRSNRYSWTRVAIFFGGLLVSVAVYFVFSVWWVSLLLFVLTLVAFAIVAHFHGQIDRSAARYTLLSYVYASYTARIQLNWDAMPPAFLPAIPPDHAFAGDLDMVGEHSIHRLLNTAISREGSQRLCDWLLQREPDMKMIRYRQKLLREMVPLTSFRNKLLLNSLRAARGAAEQLEGQRLLNWLRQHASSSGLYTLLLAASTLNILTIVLFVLGLFFALPQLWVFSVACAVILLWTTGDKRGHVFEDASYLRYAFAALSSIFTYLEHFSYGEHTELKKLCEPFFEERGLGPSMLLRKVGSITAAATLKNNGLLWVIVNALLPWDAYCAYRLSQYKKRIEERLPVWLDVWFELETLNSLATFAYLNPEYTFPEVAAGDEHQEQVLMTARDLGHPLIPYEKKVTNDFTLRGLGEIVIVTGSNMSGKSTFLRTLGVNLCLAFTGAPVNASSLCTSLFRLFTCIRVSDSVTDGYSYFYAEVRRLRQLLTAVEQGDFPVLFLIDEIFRGTNNRERLIGSRSYIRGLVGQRCLGVVSTHDLELIKLADTVPGIENYHFREEIVDGSMRFDYHLRSGPSPTTNALKIMRMEGLPVPEDEEGETTLS